jgi:hypothetical protein
LAGIRRTAIAAAVFVSLISCAARKAEQPDSKTDPERAGAVAWEYIYDTEGLRPELSPDEEFYKPYPMERPLPSYPEEALSLQTGPLAVAVRIWVEKTGAVVEVVDSPLEPSTSSPLLPLFRAEVEKAVRSWRYAPAALRTFRQGEDLDGDGKADYEILVDSKSVRVYYDIRFLFRVVEGKGHVTLQEGPEGKEGI